MLKLKNLHAETHSGRPAQNYWFSLHFLKKFHLIQISTLKLKLHAETNFPEHLHAETIPTLVFSMGDVPGYIHKLPIDR